MAQLKEVNYVDEDMLRWFKLGNAPIHRINANKAGLDKLRSHPYMNFYQAKVIIEYRRKKGKLKSLSQLSLYEEFTEKESERFALLEIHVAQEESKHGLSPEECKELLRDESLAEFQHIRICGLMGMATNTDDTGLIREEFRKIHDLFIELKETLCKDNVDFKEISMGMSHDYPIAIQEGSTLIRVGTSIFGEREY